MEFFSFIIDFILHIDQHLTELAAQYGVWIYGILFLIIFCETGLVVMPLLPGDSLLFAAGRFFGEKLFANPNSKIFKQSHLQKTQQFYAKHGGKTIILARFIPIVRTFAPFVAGMGHMTYHHFLAYNVIGGVLWVTIFSYLGYFFGNLPIVKDNLSLVLIAIIVLSILPGIIEIIRHKRAANKAGAQ